MLHFYTTSGVHIQTSTPIHSRWYTGTHHDANDTGMCLMNGSHLCRVAYSPVSVIACACASATMTTQSVMASGDAILD